MLPVVLSASVSFRCLCAQQTHTHSLLWRFCVRWQRTKFDTDVWSCVNYALHAEKKEKKKASRAEIGVQLQLRRVGIAGNVSQITCL